MTQPPEPPIQPPAGPPPAAYPAAFPPAARHARLYQAAAWVVIVAGTVFVLAVVFFAGAELTGHGPQYRPHHHGVFGPNAPGGLDGPPPYVIFPGGPFPPGPGPWGPWGPGMGPGGPGGPGGHGGPGGPEEPPPPAPTYTP
ncbi:hypothetical protein [Mycobacterium sp.]|uniref:hypothetical protein n=1 Tax=Mycobacterium sp. TaxID=1785 RepID=UPI0031D13E9E